MPGEYGKLMDEMDARERRQAMYIDRDEAIKRIRAALKRKTGKSWSVSGGRGTAWAWIRVQAPPRRRVKVDENPDFEFGDNTVTCISKTGKPPWIDRKPDEGETAYFTSYAECIELAVAIGLERPVHYQGFQVGPDETERWVLRIESDFDLDKRCPRCGRTWVREKENLHTVWECDDCWYEDDGAAFDPAMPEFAEAVEKLHQL